MPRATVGLLVVTACVTGCALGTPRYEGKWEGECALGSSEDEIDVELELETGDDGEVSGELVMTDACFGESGGRTDCEFEITDFSDDEDGIELEGEYEIDGIDFTVDAELDYEGDEETELEGDADLEADGASTGSIACDDMVLKR